MKKLAALVLATVCLAGCQKMLVPTPVEKETWTDPKTNCQWVVFKHQAGIDAEPRLDARGRQICATSTPVRSR